jgi:hypothetical protein
LTGPHGLPPIDPPARGRTPEEAVRRLVARTYCDAHLTLVSQTPADGGTLVRVRGELAGANVDRDERAWHVSALVRPTGGLAGVLGEDFEIVWAAWER